MAANDPGKAIIRPSAYSDQLTIPQPAIEAGKAYLAENTKRAYFRDWKDFFGVEDLSLVTMEMVTGTTPEKVADFRDSLIAKGLGPGTVNRKLTSVRAFFDYIVLRGGLQMNPAHSKLVRSPKKGNVHKMEGLSPEEAKTFLRAIDRGTPEGRRDYALIMTDLHMGLRRTEALSIKVDQFKTGHGKAYIVFRGKGEKERPVNINRDLEEALAAYSADRGNEPGYLFPGRTPGKPLSGDMFWRIVKKYLVIAGITKKVGTHGLRATFITHNLAAGTPLSELQKTVGHSRGETTLGYARDLEAIKSMATKAMEGLNAND
jgi:site-specific recombinase XerD